MTRPVISAPRFRGEPMKEYPTRWAHHREFRYPITHGVTVLVHWTNIAKAGTAPKWWTQWCIQGLGGFEMPRPIKGGPQRAANEAAREFVAFLRASARKIKVAA